MSKTQASRHFTNTMRPAAYKKGQLTKGEIKAQASTTNRSQITVEQQWRWHCLVGSMDEDHRALNVPDGAYCRFLYGRAQITNGVCVRVRLGFRPKRTNTQKYEKCSATQGGGLAALLAASQSDNYLVPLPSFL